MDDIYFILSLFPLAVGFFFMYSLIVYEQIDNYKYEKFKSEV
jgi:hypothetical protein